MVAFFVLLTFAMIAQKFILFLTISFLSVLLHAQFQPGRYVIYLSDKDSNEYTVSKPQNFLSSEAIVRRSMQNISIEETDLPVSACYIEAISDKGADVIYPLKWLNAIVCSVPDESIFSKIDSLPFTTILQWVAPPVDSLGYVPNIRKIRFKSFTEEINTEYGKSLEQIQMNNGQYLHKEGYKGEGMRIAILDAGFYHINSFEAYTDSDIIATRDFVMPGNDVFENHIHGASVFSIMGTNVEGEFIGTAPDASYIFIRTEDNRSEYLIEEFNWVAGAEFADSIGADLINSSLGYTLFDEPTQNHKNEELNGKTTIITQGAELAAKKGILVINSAGNEGNKPWRNISAPADAPNILTVGSVNANGTFSTFTGIGPTADLRIKPDVLAFGVKPYIFGASDRFEYLGRGTSFSAPIITGLSACLWQAFPEKTNFEIIEAIRKSGHLYHNPNYNEGYGIADFKKAYNILRNSHDSTTFEVTVYPNIISDSIFIDVFSNMLDNGKMRIAIYSANSGEMLYDQKLYKDSPYFSHSLNASNLCNGMYIVIVSIQGRNFSRKVLKM